MSARRHRFVTLASLLGLVALMVGLTAGALPLYRLLRQDASENRGPEFRPLVAAIRIHPGEERAAVHRATADQPVSFIVDPAGANDPDARYIDATLLRYTLFRAREDAPRRVISAD